MALLQRGVILEGRYDIIEQIGEGGFGTVYRAIDRRFGRQVAIKVLSLEKLPESSHEQARMRFDKEASLLRDLRHPNLPVVHDKSEIGNTLYFVMDFIAGEDLSSYLEKHEQLSEHEAIELILPVLDALAYLHAQDPPIIHRDIKPGNIIRTLDGQIYLVDFGLAKLDHGQRRHVPTAGFASEGYTAPEQYHQQVDPRADIYGIGATLYTLLIGKPPPGATERSLAIQTRNPDSLQIQSSPTMISPRMAAVLKRLLALDPNERYQSAQDVKVALQGFSRRLAVPTEPVSLYDQDKKDTLPTSKSHQRLVLVLSAVFALLLLSSGSYLAYQRQAAAAAASATATSIALVATDSAATAAAVSQAATSTTLAEQQTSIARRETTLAQTATAEQVTAEARREQGTATARAATTQTEQAAATALAREIRLEQQTATALALVQQQQAATATAQTIAQQETATAQAIAQQETATAQAIELSSRPASLTSPPLAMIPIQGGTFLMGRDDTDTEGRDDDFEKPRYTSTVQPFWISQTEVTNEQFFDFVRDDGYDEREYWTDPGWAWRQANNRTEPGCWSNPDLNAPEQPVVCVSWHEAVAYTNWLSEQTGDLYLLPSETEWERAARGINGRLYPWGDTPPDSNRAVFADTNVTAPRPVASLPDGATPEGIYDMAGNAWEWTRSLYCFDMSSREQCEKTLYRYPYNAQDGRERLPSTTAGMAIRGGSWNNAPAILQAFTRDPLPPDANVPNVGFRVVAYPEE